MIPMSLFTISRIDRVSLYAFLALHFEGTHINFFSIDLKHVTCKTLRLELDYVIFIIGNIDGKAIASRSGRISKDVIYWHG